MSDEPGNGTAGDEVDDFDDDAEVDNDFFDDDVDEDLWGSSEPRGPVDRRIIVGIIGVVAVLIVGFLVFGGGSGSDDEGATSAAQTTTAAGGGDQPEATTQLTSQRAPYNAEGITPTTLPPGAKPTGCGDWDSAFNYPPKEITDGVYIWSDFEGWHVRIAGTSVPELTGSVTGQYTPPVQKQTEGVVQVTPDEVGHRLNFSMAPGGTEPVGFDFSAGCNQKELTFDLTSQGTSVPVEQVHLGSRGAVEEYPLVARRTLPAPG